MNPHFRSPWPTSPWHLAISQVWNNDTAKALHLDRHLLWFIPHVAAQKQWTSANHFASFWIACTQPPIWITLVNKLYTDIYPYPPLRPRAAAPAQWAKSGKGQLKTKQTDLDNPWYFLRHDHSNQGYSCQSNRIHPKSFWQSWHLFDKWRYTSNKRLRRGAPQEKHRSMQYDAMRPSNSYTVSGCESWTNHPPPGDRNWCLGIAICCAKDIEKHLQKKLFASWVCFIFFVVSNCFSVFMSISLSFFPSSV